jgi:hypothetical protein
MSRRVNSLSTRIYKFKGWGFFYLVPTAKNVKVFHQTNSIGIYLRLKAGQKHLIKKQTSNF